MVETIKTATAVEEGKGGDDHGSHPRENKHRKSTGAAKSAQRSRGEKPAQCRRVGISDFSGVVTSMRNAAECRG